MKEIVYSIEFKLFVMGRKGVPLLWRRKRYVWWQNLDKICEGVGV